jgi:hypothetical protein
MILWCGLVFAEPGMPVDTEARLLLDEERFDEVEALIVEARLLDGLPWVQIENVGVDPITVDWAASTITPPNDTPQPVLPLVRSEHDPDRPVAPPPPSTLAPGERRTWAVFPRDWADDAIDDEEQLVTWQLTSFSGLELAVERGERRGTYTALWRTELREAPALPLALPVAPKPVPMPRLQPTAATLEARREWDAAYRGYRRQQRNARSAWVSAAVIGGLTALNVAGNVQSFYDAPADGTPDQNRRTRADYQARALVYTGLTAGAIGVVVPFVIVEQRSKRKLRELGRRP